jgi:DNA-binding CsgD family transcriptional regulator
MALDLSPREIYVLMLRFGLYDGKSKTLEEIAQSLHATRERVRHIETKALDKLQASGREKFLENPNPISDFLDVVAPFEMREDITDREASFIGFNHWMQIRLIKIVTSPETKAKMEQLEAQIVAQALATYPEPDPKALTSLPGFYEFYDCEPHLFGEIKFSKAAIALVWPYVTVRKMVATLDAKAFRAGRDQWADTFGRVVLQTVIWNGFNSWSPPEDLVSAIGQYKELIGSQGTVGSWQQKVKEWQAEAAEFAREEQGKGERLALENQAEWQRKADAGDTYAQSVIKAGKEVGDWHLDSKDPTKK